MILALSLQIRKEKALKQIPELPKTQAQQSCSYSKFQYIQLQNLILFTFLGIGEQDHDVGQLVGGPAVLGGGGQQASAVTAGGGRGHGGGSVGG